MIIPHRRFARRLLFSAALIWAGVRAGIAVLGIGLGTGWLFAGGVIGLSVVLALMDIRRTAGQLFLHNLGVSRAVVVGITAVPPTLLEAVWAIVVPR